MTTTENLVTVAGWIARKADGSLDLNGFRKARVEADGSYVYVGPAFSVA